MKSLKIRLIGGLGNQLFQVAFGYSLRKIYSQPVIYDISAFKNYKLHKLVVDKLFPNLPFINLKKNIFQIPIKEKYCGFDEMLFQRIKNSLIYRNIYLSGYFQSLAYFSNDMPAIKIQIKENIELLFPILKKDFLRNKLRNTLGVHIRRGNKAKKFYSNIYGNLTIEEISQNINSIYYQGDYKNILLVGDDIEFLKKLRYKINSTIKINLINEISSENNDLIDFYLLSLVKGLVISNSTFSLWAGYLSDNKVFYPEPFYPLPRNKSFLNQNHEDLIYPNWIPYKVKYS